MYREQPGKFEDIKFNLGEQFELTNPNEIAPFFDINTYAIHNSYQVLVLIGEMTESYQNAFFTTYTEKSDEKTFLGIKFNIYTNKSSDITIDYFVPENIKPLGKVCM